MSEIEKEPLEIEKFYTDVKARVKEGMTYRDAVQLSAVTLGGEIARLVSPVISKYQEATFVKTELSQQPNVDECALASMGKLWHGENFEGNNEQMICTEEETFLDSLYFVLKYAKSENALEEALAANDTVCGDKTARRAIIEMAFDF
ncbi:hypothetical protein C9926_02545 [Sulfurovum lithotrophicum]|nr:hypothetical protein C9926_02545 [Sulfurovum lithotrophicum]